MSKHVDILIDLVPRDKPSHREDLVIQKKLFTGGHVAFAIEVRNLSLEHIDTDLSRVSKILNEHLLVQTTTQYCKILVLTQYF